jgi:hypothetical protein
VGAGSRGNIVYHKRKSKLKLPTDFHTGSIKCLSDWPGCCWRPIGLTSSQIEVSDFREPRVKSSNRRLDADDQRLKWAARIVRAREYTVTFANADPEENP